MEHEIERKFLVTSKDFKKEAFKQSEIKQGFLSTKPKRTVRIRVSDAKGFITIKGKGNESGITRYEWEKEIPLKEAENLLLLCKKNMIEKTRFYVQSENHIFEVDEFHGSNQGLVIAEIELQAEDEVFKKPSWLGKEVTGKKKYYNSMLLKKPYKKW